MKKCFKKALSGILTTAMLFSSIAFTPVTASAAPSFSSVGGWYETLYAEVSGVTDAQVTDVSYSGPVSGSLTGDDLTYLVRDDGNGVRIDIPGLKAGMYTLSVTANGSTITRSGIKVQANDRSGYAHFNYNQGVGAYNNDGTPKENALVVYVTEENKNTVEVPGYEGRTWSYTPSSGSPYTRDGKGIGNILNNNMKLVQDVTITDNHPLIIRLVGNVTPPANLTPHAAKDPILGGSTSDNGNLAITKYARNVTIEGIGDDTEVNGWGFTFSQTKTCPAEAGESIEVRNVTFRNYPEDALAFQGDDAITSPIRRVWVHNNTFYPGYCSNPTESDKKEGDGSCDFKRGQYYTMAYNHYIKCHKTNLIGASASEDQYYMTLHHNWYESVGSRQPLAAGGNIHIYSTYFQNATSTTVDCRGKNATFLEENYYENCKNYYGSRNNTCSAKSYNEIFSGGTLDSVSGKRVIAKTRDEAGIASNGLNLPNGDAITNFDTNSTHFYYDSANKKSNVSVLTPAAEVPEFVTTHAGTLQALPVTESGEIQITVKSGNTAVTGATVTGGGLTFTEQGNGVYTATAELGVAYDITVSKEGYSNVTIKTTALNNNGDVYKGTANMVVDNDGYAVVQIVGGADKTPVKGATVTLNNGTVLADQGDGTYKSASQIATGSYTATITNTGDYIAPTSAVNVQVKSTDEATVVTLAKHTGTVNVSIVAADGETETLDASKAEVKVGDTTLTYNNGVFTGAVEVGTPYNVSVNMLGWNTVSVSPATVTANRNSAVSATATLSYKGALFTWNYTDGTNTDNFFNLGTTSDWSSAKNSPQTYDGQTLTKAIKVQSGTQITFNAPADGTLTLVMEGTGSVAITNNGEKTVSNVTTGVNVINVKAGANVLSRDKTETHLYLLQYCASGSSTPVDPDTTATTEATTEATTKDATTEATTSAPVVQGQISKFYVNAADATANGDDIANNATSIFTNAATGTGSLAAAATITIDGKNYTLSKRSGNGAHSLTIVVPSGVTNATLYVYGNSSGASSTRKLSLSGVTATGAATGSAGSLSTFTGLNAGTYTLTADGNWGYSFLALSVPKTGGDNTTEATTETTTVTTTETTTTTTTETTTTTTTETTTTTTESTTEQTTQEPDPVSGVKLSVGTASAKVGDTIVIPVKLTGVSTLASYDVNITYDSTKLTATSVTAGNMVTDSNAAMSYNIGNGTIGVTGSNPKDVIAAGNDILFNITFTVKAEGTANISASVDEIYVADNTKADATTTAGSVTIESETPTPVLLLGDANGDGTVNEDDVTHILQYVVHKIASVINPEAADVTKDNKVDVTDAYKISRFVKGLISSLD